jgi:Frag1/DRAM/Sfk1 family.
MTRRFLCCNSRQIIRALPIVTVLISVITIVIAYTVATNGREASTSNCTLHRGFPPYISDVGDCKPQSSVFTFGMVMSGCISFIIFFFRYLQVRNFYAAREKANFASIITGVVLVVGKFMAISFQLSSHKLVHYFGALGYFLGTFIYVCLQTRISYQKDQLLFYVRLFCSVGLSITGLLFGIFIIPSVEAKYIDLSISQISEWCFAAIKMFFMLTFWLDFKYISPIIDTQDTRRASYIENSSYEDITEEEV